MRKNRLLASGRCGDADGSWSNAFEFRGPESYHQLAEQFSELARLLAEADEKENHEG